MCATHVSIYFSECLALEPEMAEKDSEWEYLALTLITRHSFL